MSSVVLVVVAFLVMEPVTYATHRWVMHGPGFVWHRSHHRRGNKGWELNDLYPAVFAIAVMAAMALGFQRATLSWLIPLAIGVTLYGAAYALVHDVYIHRRLPWFARGARHARHLDRLADAHELHHRFGGEPYGMLLPVIPATLRARANRRLPV